MEFAHLSLHTIGASGNNAGVTGITQLDAQPVEPCLPLGRRRAAAAGGRAAVAGGAGGQAAARV